MMRPPVRRLLPLVALLSPLFTAPATAAPGDLDYTFHSFGWTTLPAGSAGIMHTMAVQSDGKILLAGSEQSGPAEDLVLRRVLPDGSPDTSFNGTGRTALAVAESDIGHAIAFQSDGKILVAGGALASDSASFLLARYLTNGALDPAFAAGAGYVTYYFPPAAGGRARAIAVQSDGKILIAGESEKVIRYHADGTLDTAFSTGGGQVHAIALQTDGKILLASDAAFSVTRRNADGTPDLSFNGTGKSVIPAAATAGSMKRLAVQTDGKILAAGSFVPGGGGSDLGVVRIRTDGTLDPAFNATGLAVSGLGAAETSSLILQSDGKILVAGTRGEDISLARFNANGLYDATFGTGGKVQTDFGASSETCAGAAFLPNGKLITAGRYRASALVQPEFFLARYQMTALPEIAVEQPAGTELANNALLPVDFGLVPTAAGGSKIFTVRNAGQSTLTGLTLSFAAGGNPSDFSFSPPAAATLTSGAETTFTVSFNPATPGARTATLQVLSNDSDDNPFLIRLTGTRAEPGIAWRLIYFSTTENTGNAADMSDPDHDGIPNIVEYATNSHPLQFSPPPGSLQKVGNNLEFTYTRPATAVPELTYQPEASSLVTAPWGTTNVTSTIINTTAGIQTVKVTVPASTGIRFVRLRITRPQ